MTYVCIVITSNFQTQTKMTEKYYQVKRGAQLILMALLAFGKTASSQCTSEFTIQEFPQGCDVFVGFVVNANPTTDSVVFDYGNGETFTTNGISGEALYTGGSYTVEVTAYHTNGCISSSTQNITIGGMIVEIDADTLACQSDLELNTYVSGGSGNYSFSWSPDFGLDDPTLQNPTLSSNVLEEEYTVTVTDGVSGCELSSSIIVTRQSPLFDTLSLCDGAVTIDLGPGAIAYQWLTHTDTAGNSSNLNYPTTQQSILVDDPGDYFMYADFPQCGALTSLVTVEACEQACWNLFTYNLITGSCIGEGYSFVGTGDGTVIEYYWDFGDGVNSTNPYPVHAFPIGTFEVTLTTVNMDGCVATSSQFITNTAPNFGVIASADTSACQGPAFIDAEIYGGSGDYDFEWTPQYGLDDPLSLSTHAEGVHEQLYTIYVVDINTNCVTVDSVIVSSYVAIHDTLELCNDSVYLDMGPGGVFYNWLPLYDDDYETQGIWTDDPGSYAVYAEYPGCGLITHTFLIEECEDTCTSGIFSSFQPDGCGGWMNFVPTFSTPYDSLYFDFGNGNTLSTTGTSAQQYYNVGIYEVVLVVYHSNGCISESTETINVEPELTVEIWNDSVACAGDIILSAAINGGSGNYEYQWFFGGLPFVGDDLPNPMVGGIIQPTEVALYLTDITTGCQVADTAWVYPNVQLTETYELCGNSVLFDAPSFSQTYSWTFEDQQGNTTTLSQDGPLMEATEIGTYTCLSYTSGCDPVEHTFYVVECSTGCYSYFTFNSVLSGCGALLEFVPGYTPDIDSLFYAFGDGTFLTVTNGNTVQHQYQNGVYEVNMVAYHEDGCISEMVETVVVDGSLEGDILNDSVACAGDIYLSAILDGGSGNHE